MTKHRGAMIATGNTKGNRRDMDSYPTPSSVTIALLDFIKLPKRCVIWEPACGSYAMSKVIRSYGYKVIETDILYGNDYLTTIRRADAIITNPPFNLSEQFIRKAVKEASVVAFLLKSQYWHAAKRFKLFEETRPSYVLPLTWRPDFYGSEETGKKENPTMDVAWTIWQRGYVGATIYEPIRRPLL